ncbi:beta-glucosidase [Deinococcus murrayi]|uniref:beta-glucosidase n=1 Tax=Deinococcus murrayi TaxID=68910 RepID=UPI000487CE41|nr:beta-glucosidase [Deinococcus murrayi]
MPQTSPPFASFLMGGFECSSHRRRDRTRLDLIAATQHDRFARQDYDRLRARGILTARDGLRWHLIETRPGSYDFSSFLPMLRASRAAGVQVIWDLMHYGWPDDTNPLAPGFTARAAAFAGAVARLLAAEGETAPWLVPVNEISFLAWAGGEVGYMNPWREGEGHRLKRRLVQASLAMMDAVWAELPAARFLHTEPLIHVVAHPQRPADAPNAAAFNRGQFEAWDMLAGTLHPELGGHPRYLGLLGVNYYGQNQWVHHDSPAERELLPPGHPWRRPLDEMLQEVWQRYGRPLCIAETGAEGDARVPWLRSVGEEVRRAMSARAPVQGLCFYPILDYPGWDDDRHCPTGLWGYADDAGHRPEYPPLAEELAAQAQAFAAL